MRPPSRHAAHQGDRQRRSSRGTRFQSGGLGRVASALNHQRSMPCGRTTWRCGGDWRRGLLRLTRMQPITRRQSGGTSDDRLRPCCRRLRRAPLPPRPASSLHRCRSSISHHYCIDRDHAFVVCAELLLHLATPHRYIAVAASQRVDELSDAARPLFELEFYPLSWAWLSRLLAPCGPAAYLLPPPWDILVATLHPLLARCIHTNRMELC